MWPLTNGRRRRPVLRRFAQRTSASPRFEQLETRTLLSASLPAQLVPSVCSDPPFATSTTLASAAKPAGLQPLAAAVTALAPASSSQPLSLAPFTPANVLVNDPTADLTTNDTQSETSVIVFGSTVLVGFNDSGSAAVTNAASFTGYALSTDGGNTFTDMGRLPSHPNGDRGDPVLVRDSVTGRIYYATLFSSGTGLQVFRSDDDGLTFGTPVQAAPGFASTEFLDKPWMAIDNFPGPGQGNVYLAFTSIDEGITRGIFLTTSEDGGETWGPAGGALVGAGEAVQGSWVAVGPDHTLYLFWFDGDPEGPGIRMRRSTDFGASFGPTITVADLATTGQNGDLSLGGFRSNAFPHAAVNPVTGHLYLVYNDNPPGVDRADILFTQSTDGGETWSAPLRVNDDATSTDQFHPTIAVTPDGSRLFVGFYDRRIDPANILIDTFGAIASIDDSTVTFGGNFRVSSASFPPVIGVDPGVRPPYMGDYDGADADDQFFYFAWGDNRDPSLARPGNQADIRFARIPVGGPAGPGLLAVDPPAGLEDLPLTAITLTFSRDIDTSSFSLDDDLISFTAPDGSDLRSQITGFDWNSPTQLEIRVTSQRGNGLYTLILGPAILGLSDAAPLDQNFNGVAGEPEDQAVVLISKTGAAGPRVFSHTISSAASTVDFITFVFSETMDTTSFSLEDIVSFTGPGGADLLSHVTSFSWRAPNRLRVQFVPQRANGDYTMVLAPQIAAALDGAPIDQDADGTPAEPDEDAYTAAFTKTGAAGPSILSSSPEFSADSFIAFITFTFSEAMDPASFAPDEDVLSFNGPDNADLRSRITGHNWVNPSTLRIHFTPLHAPGAYTMTLGPEIAAALDGAPLDQDADGLAGEPSEDSFTATLAKSGPAGPAVSSSSPSFATSRLRSITFTFDEPMDTASFSKADIVSFTGPDGADLLSRINDDGFEWLSPTSLQIRFRDQRSEGNYSLVIGPNILAASDGAPMDQNRDGLAGAPDDTFTADFFIIGALGPEVTASSPDGTLLATAVSLVSFSFSESMDTASFSVEDDLFSFTGPGGADLKPLITGFEWSGSTLLISFPPQTAEGTYSLTIGPDILSRPMAGGLAMDQNGNGILAEEDDRYTATFSISSCAGPDAFGYTACAAPFEPIDLLPGASGVVTLIDGQNNRSDPIPLGSSTFNFYGVTYTGADALFASTNGLITFISGNSSNSNGDLTSSPQQAAIAPLWDNWQTQRGPDSILLYKFEDLDANSIPDRLIIEWSDVANGSGPVNGTATFQAILHLNTGDAPGLITFNYVDLDVGSASVDNGASATVGIKDAGAQGPRRLLAAFNDPDSTLLGSGRAIAFTVPVIGSISGRKFQDNNADGLQDPGEPGLPGWTIFLDANDNALLDPGEISLLTDGNGNYSFQGLPAGEYIVRELPQPGWMPTAPSSGSHIISLDAGENVSGADFANAPSIITGTSGEDSYRVRLSPAGDRVHIFENVPTSSPPTFSLPVALLTTLTFNTGPGDDDLILDLSGGNPIPPGGLFFNGGSQSGSPGDILTIIGGGSSAGSYIPSPTTNGSGTVLLDGAAVHFTGLEPVVVSAFASFSLVTPNSADLIAIDSPAPGQNRVSGSSGGVSFESLTFFNVATFILDTDANDGPAADDTITISAAGLAASGLNTFQLKPGPGQNTLTINGGSTRLNVIDGEDLSLRLNGSAAVTLLASQKLASITLNDTARVDLPAGGQKILHTRALSIAPNATLDLHDNDLILQSADPETDLASLSALIAAARNGGAWNRPGLTSSAARNDLTQLTGLAILRNSDNGLTPLYTEFNGLAVDENAILIKHTWNGDMDANGLVDIDDYFFIDTGFLSLIFGEITTPTYRNGDLDFNGLIDIDDYFLIDVAFLRQDRIL